MKKSFFYVIAVLLLTLIFTLTSCNKDEFQPDQNTPAIEALKPSSETIRLMQRTADNDGSFDNIIDNASCIELLFPYEITVNNISLTVSSEDQLEVVEELLDAIRDYRAELALVFPITVTLADYSTTTLNSIDELETLAKTCQELGDDDDIECIDFVYPFNLFTYNAQFVETGTVSVANDSELRRFFTGLSENDLISLAFPMQLQKLDGSTIEVNSYVDLAANLSGAEDACDEDDDNDYGDDDFTEDSLKAELVECKWLIENDNATAESTSGNFEGFILDFDENGAIRAEDNTGNSYDGNWYTLISDYQLQLVIEFEQLTSFNATWSVSDLNDDYIKWSASEGEQLILQNFCEEMPPACRENEIREFLETCMWLPSQGEDSFLDEFKIDFSGGSLHVLDTDDTAIDEGYWELSGNTITFFNLSMAMANYNGAWKIVECEDDRLELHNDGGILVLNQDCEEQQSNCDEDFITEALGSCVWLPSQDDQSFLEGLEFDFSGGSIHVRNEQAELVDEGYWELSGNTITFFNLSMAMANYNGAWKIVECEDDRLELRKDGGILVLNQDCKDSAANCEEDFIREELGSCVWLTSQENQPFLNGYKIDFSGESLHVFDAEDKAIDEGYWELSGNTITFFNLSMALANYIGEWEIIACGTENFQLKRNEEILQLAKDCE